MNRSGMRAVILGGVLLATAAPLSAQGYHVRLDSRFQSVAYRGLEITAIAAGDVVTGADGGSYTPDGIAVWCPAGAAFCNYFAPGDERRGAPVVSTVDAALWGLGIQGLTVRTRARFGRDLRDPDAWPGAEPPAQILEGYAEYLNGPVTLQVGRTHTVSRLGMTGVDGARVSLRPFGGKVRLGAYGGWGFARATPLTVSSPEVNPLNEFQPAERQRLVGGSLGWTVGPLQARVLYQRAIDPRDELSWVVASERGVFDATLRPFDCLTVTGGAEYDVARRELGTADLRVQWREPGGRIELTTGGKQYRPYFDLWTIWGVFSPVPYRSVFGTARVVAVGGLELWTRGERYAYQETEAESSLVQVEDGGWRWSSGATFTRLHGWLVDAGYHVEKGAGAASLGLDGRVQYQPMDAVAVMAHGSYRTRPLEYRFSEAQLMTLGLQVDVEPTNGLRVNAGAVYWDELRDREDAAAMDWNQVRLHVGLTVAFGSADRASLHPAILRMPEGDAP
jgi:hypothetical protein